MDITGTSANEALIASYYPESGDDYIQGLGGSDELYGGEGDDTLLGGDGHDYLIGDYGLGEDYSAYFGDYDDDVLYGGAGADKFFLMVGFYGDEEPSIDVIKDFNRAEGDKIDVLQGPQLGVSLNPSGQGVEIVDLSLNKVIGFVENTSDVIYPDDFTFGTRLDYEDCIGCGVA